MAISIVPSLIFICAVVGLGWYQSDVALRDRSTAVLVGEGVDATGALSTAVLSERRISVQGGGDMTAARNATDAAVAQVRAFMAKLPDTAPVALRASFMGLGTAAEAVSRERRDIDSGARDQDAYAAFEPVVEPLISVIGPQVAPGSDADVVTAMAAAGNLLAVVESIDSADLVLATNGRAGLGVQAYRDLSAEVGQIGEAMQQAVAVLPASRRDAGTALLDSPQWRTFSADTDLALAAGPHIDIPAPDGPSISDTQRNAARIPVDPTAAVVGDLTAAGEAVAVRAADIAFGSAHDGVALAVDRTSTALNLIVGVVLGGVALVVVAMLVAMRTGNRMGRRMAALQASTHASAARLPALLERIRRGEPVDVDAEFPAVDHGTDEIGEVGAAVDAAQRTAVAAAAEEARTRAGANAVFLNIAHRSQAIVHRQLQVLDEAERAEDDSDQLARLFQLDHLSTRERRNAENLIIMGGQEPRRRWRRPVPLAEIIRSAVSESEQYTRITLGEAPYRHVDGAAVGDLIHLLAELVDNATSFSPPQCPIDISASIVGRGVAVEIEDRGLGIEPEPRDRLNEMLAEPLDFGLLTLSEDARLGMFVVSRLAQRHGVRVTLLESTYGGVRALVLVPNTLLVAPREEEEPEVEPEPARGAGTPFGRGSNGRRSDGPHSDGAYSDGRNSDGRGSDGRHSDGGHLDGRVANGHFSDADAPPRGSVAPRSPRQASPAADLTTAPRAARPALPERTSRAAASPAAGGTAEPPATVAALAPAAALVAEPVAAPAAGPGEIGPTEIGPGEVGPGAIGPVEVGPPPLPERRPQGHLAMGLRDQPATGQVPAASEPVEPTAGRSSSAMSAMQRGVRSSRRDAAEDGSAT